MTKKRDNNVFSQALLTIGGAIGGWIAYSAMAVDHDMGLPQAINATREEMHGTNSTFLSYYADTTGEGVPLVLLHSINAAASAYEMKPLFDYYRGKRPIYALELPGYGFSERADRSYTPELFAAAIRDFLHTIDTPADVITLSLSSEFAAISATDEPELFRSITMISPTGFSKSSLQGKGIDEELSDRLYKFFSFPGWSQALYDLLTINPSIRYFLGKQFVGEPDEGMIEYAYKTSHQQGARYAPYHFVSGKLFTPDIFHKFYYPLRTPALVLYDEDPNVNFDALPTMLERNESFTARRIPNTLGLPHFERLDKVAEALENFWSDVD